MCAWFGMMHPVCAALQNDSDQHLSAKEVFLRSAKVSGWAIAWLGAGKAALLVGSQDQAEAGLSEANNRCPMSAKLCGCLSVLHVVPCSFVSFFQACAVRAFVLPLTKSCIACCDVGCEFRAVSC